MKAFIKALEGLTRRLNQVAVILSSVLVFFMMVLTFVDVTGRYFIRPVLGGHELTYLALAVLVCLGFGSVQLEKGHIAIGVIIDRLSPRVQAAFDAITYLVMVIVLSLMTWQTVVFANRTQTAVSGELGLPIYVFVYICAIGIALYALTTLLDLFRSLMKVVNPADES